MGTTAWTYKDKTWTEQTVGWKSNDDWGWREELKNNGYEVEPAVRLGDLDTDSLAAEAYPKSGDGGGGWAVVVSVGEGGDVVLVDRLPDLLALLAEIGPSVEKVAALTGGATNALEREYARLRKIGYPHEVADAASRTFAEEVED